MADERIHKFNSPLAEQQVGLLPESRSKGFVSEIIMRSWSMLWGRKGRNLFPVHCGVAGGLWTVAVPDILGHIVSEGTSAQTGANVNIVPAVVHNLFLMTTFGEGGVIQLSRDGTTFLGYHPPFTGMGPNSGTTSRGSHFVIQGGYNTYRWIFSHGVARTMYWTTVQLP